MLKGTARRILRGTGDRAIGRWLAAVNLTGIVWSVLRLSLRPRYWTRTVRDVLARQVYFTGLEAVRFVVMVAVLVGVGVVVQAQVWLAKVGQSELIGPLLVAVIVRELGPLLTNFIVIGRSGTAIASELAGMRVHDEVRILDAQGLDPFVYLVLPRVTGVMISVFCLTVIFILVSFLSGFGCGVLLGLTSDSPGVFFDGVLGAISPKDVCNVLAKTLVPGLLTGAICSVEGLSISGMATEVPQAAGRAVIRSVSTLFVTSALVSLVTYI